MRQGGALAGPHADGLERRFKLHRRLIHAAATQVSRVVVLLRIVEQDCRCAASMPGILQVSRLVLAASVAQRKIQVAEPLSRGFDRERHLHAILAFDLGSVSFAHLLVSLLVVLSFHVAHNQWSLHFVNVERIFVDLVIWLSFQFIEEIAISQLWLELQVALEAERPPFLDLYVDDFVVVVLMREKAFLARLSFDLRFRREIQRLCVDTKGAMARERFDNFRLGRTDSDFYRLISFFLFQCKLGRDGSQWLRV